AAVGNLSEYLSLFNATPTADLKPASAEIQASIDSGTWNGTATLNLADSKPIRVNGTLPLQIGKDWQSFSTSPLNVTADFPAISLPNASRFLHLEIFQNGNVSGKLSLSETLQHPRIVGEVELTNGKLQNAPTNLTDV